MDRRRFLLTSVAAALAAPLDGEAQQAVKMARVGILNPMGLGPTAQRPAVGITAHLSGRLNELGWVEGKSLVFEPRFADGNPIVCPVSPLIWCASTSTSSFAVSRPAIGAAGSATSTVPLVMAFSGIDPVKAGFVASLARPGGNVTGLSILATAVTVKRLEVLKEALPRASRVAVLVNPRNPSTTEQLAALTVAASALGLQMQPVEVGRSDQYADGSSCNRPRRPGERTGSGDPIMAASAVPG